MAHVAIEHLTKVYSGPDGRVVAAVRNLSLAVGAGELLALVGPSGSGKTTLLRLIAGLEQPTEGEIAIGGRVVNRVPPQDRNLAMVFQTPALYPHLTASENMALGLRLRRHPAMEIERRVRAAAETLDLGACLDCRPMELSGGERQRVALGRALVREPKVLLLDEPLSHLDASLRAQLRLELVRLHARLDSTMLCVTHDQEEAMALGQRVAVLREGVVEQIAAPQDLYQRPANLFVAGFIGTPPMNFVRGRLAPQDGGVWFTAGPNEDAPKLGPLTFRLEDAAAAEAGKWLGKEVVVGLRPEHLSVSEEFSPDPGRWRGEATIEGVELTGPDAILRVSVCGWTLCARVSFGQSFAVDRQILLAFEARRAHFFDPETNKSIACAC